MGAADSAASPSAKTLKAALEQPSAIAGQATAHEHEGGQSTVLSCSTAADELAASAKAGSSASGIVLPADMPGLQQQASGQSRDTVDAAAAARCSQPAACALEGVPMPALDVRPESSTDAPPKAEGLRGQREDALEAWTAGGAGPIKIAQPDSSGDSLPLLATASAASGVSGKSTAAPWDVHPCDAATGKAQRSVQRAGRAKGVADLLGDGSSPPAGAAMAASSSVHSGQTAVQCSAPGGSIIAMQAEVASVPLPLQGSSAPAGLPGSAAAVPEHSASEEHGVMEQMAEVGGQVHAAESVQPAAMAVQEHCFDKPCADADTVAQAAAPQAAAPVLPAPAAFSAGGAGQQGRRLSLTRVAEQPRVLAADDRDARTQPPHGTAAHPSAAEQVSPILPLCVNF